MVLVQIWPLFEVFFIGNIGQENVFYGILEKKKAFLGYKKKKFKKAKSWHFSKGKKGPKMALFPSFFLGNMGEEILFYDILERKKPF